MSFIILPIFQFLYQQIRISNYKFEDAEFPLSTIRINQIGDLSSREPRNWNCNVYRYRFLPIYGLSRQTLTEEKAKERRKENGRTAEKTFLWAIPMHSFCLCYSSIQKCNIFHSCKLQIYFDQYVFFSNH